MKRVIMLAASVSLLSCKPAEPGQYTPAANVTVTRLDNYTDRLYDAEQGVVCYRYLGNGISCLSVR
jgi:hypothetical protein